MAENDIEILGMTNERNNDTLEHDETDSKNKENETGIQDDESYDEENESNGCLLKWVFIFLSGVILLGLLVWGKLSFLSLAEAMHDDDDFGLQSRCRIFVMLQIILCLPQALNLIRGVWYGCIRTHVHVPKKTIGVVILVIILSGIEAAGTCAYTFLIPGLTKTHHIVLLMSCIFTLPACSNIIIFLKRTRNCCSKDLLLSISLIVAELAAIALTFVWLDYADLKKTVITFLAISFLSLSWMPWLRRWLLDQFIKTVPTKLTSASIWKFTAIMSLSNLVSTIVASFGIFFGFNLNPYMSNQTTTVLWKDYVSGWKEWQQASQHEILLFVTHIFSGILVTFSTPIIFAILVFPESCKWVLSRNRMANHFEDCTIGESNQGWDIVREIIAIVCLILAQTFSSGWKFCSTEYLQHLSEEQIFRIPAYNSVFLDQWLLLNGQNKEDDSKDHMDPKTTAKRSKIYICTTMYREADHEMEQFIRSVLKIKKAHRLSNRNIEVHIFFDDAVRGNSLNDFAVQLVTQVENILNCTDKSPFKQLSTPYGICLGWEFNTNGSNVSLPFKIHLKDALKVKAKKRWSQVMYMAYVLKYLLKKKREDPEQPSTSRGSSDPEQPSTSRGSIQTTSSSETRSLMPEQPTIDCGATDRRPVVDPETESYLLVTDADVTFTPDSVEYLLDLVMRDANLGAACARIHPQGSGPLYWYQIFEYAIGHWLQKAAEQILGTVLCAPGCFSIYRCKAVGDVLAKYDTNVEDAFDFLIKDMGEDRWFCTLMIQEGWFIEYCAASKVQTHCPQQFAEFLKQRRRWLASTVANVWLLIKDWDKVTKKNHRVSFMFRFYQFALLLANLIGPSSTILLVAGGLRYGLDWSTVPTIIVQVIVSFGFGTVCLLSSQKTQVKVARILIFLYAVVMTPTIVGMAAQITMDFINSPEAETNLISQDIRISTSTLFLSFVLGTVLLTGIMHTNEFLCLFHGILYMLCLPAGFLILPIYSLCNITDKSWGTRELETHTDTTVSLLDSIKNVLSTCSCYPCKNGKTVKDEENDLELSPTVGNLNEDESTFRKEIHSVQRQSSGEINGDIDSDAEDETGQEIKDWMQCDVQTDMSDVYEKFVRNGYDKMKFISGMTKRDIKDIGITSTIMIRLLEKIIKELPDASSTISPEIPENTTSWLRTIGLTRYKDNFDRIGRNVEVLQNLRPEELNVTKKGHVKWLMKAMKKIRYPNDHEKAQLKTKKILREKAFEKEHEEDEFWKTTIESMNLRPNTFDHHSKKMLADNLVELRHGWILVFTVSNLLWLIMITTLAYKGELLNVFGTNVIGLVVLIILVFLLFVQFIAMLIHRCSTLIHHVGRASYKCNGKKHLAFAFNERDMSETQPKSPVRTGEVSQGIDNNARSQLIENNSSDDVNLA
ncbi:chitin synthase chs-1-like isoform X2 [Mercenaria mercenaria]|uniref:chitin synthase chs-1-like isoform X2 n=1 Tax=Mercenaria mercenaria TaxID=6596 RepID=UPI00234E3B48|nr:chitin synthase chs-1-like isoform X2 [Mercenaria mercenaria]